MLQIHQQKGDMPTFICNSVHAEQTHSFLCHPAVLATCFLLDYCDYGVVKYVKSIALKSVSRHDGVLLEYKDVMT